MKTFPLIRRSIMTPAVSAVALAVCYGFMSGVIRLHGADLAQSPSAPESESSTAPTTLPKTISKPLSPPLLEPYQSSPSGQPSRAKTSEDAVPSQPKSNNARSSSNSSNRPENELSAELQRRLGPGFDGEKLRHLLQNNPQSPETQAALKSIRLASKSLLQGEPKLSRANLSSGATKSSKSMPQDLSARVPRKVPLSPLPAIAPTKNPAECERDEQIEKLRAGIASEKDLAKRDHLRLTLGGYLVGKDDWGSAKALYDELADTSGDSEIVQAARRNQIVVDKRIEVLSERNPGEKDELELELAEIHQELGHEKASKEISRRLVGKAGATSVRDQAQRLLNSDSRPARPPLPSALQRPLEPASGPANSQNRGAQ